MKLLNKLKLYNVLVLKQQFKRFPRIKHSEIDSCRLEVKSGTYSEELNNDALLKKTREKNLIP